MELNQMRGKNSMITMPSLLVKLHLLSRISIPSIVIIFTIILSSQSIDFAFFFEFFTPLFQYSFPDPLPKQEKCRLRTMFYSNTSKYHSFSYSSTLYPQSRIHYSCTGKVTGKILLTLSVLCNVEQTSKKYYNKNEHVLASTNRDSLKSYTTTFRSFL
uniref:Uncharacterized protein n=1 Tax=Sphaerodactylus townsendi TaxID=933632 RepID=A0ACB8G1Q3_9SAUR